MPSRATVEAFASLVEAGDYVGAIEQFYAPDASTRDGREHGSPARTASMIVTMRTPETLLSGASGGVLAAERGTLMFVVNDG